MKVVGIDLAGKEENETGFCVLSDSGIETFTLFTDSEILEKVRKVGPEVIGIDAPLSFPEAGLYRESEKLLLERGFKPVSTRFPGMRVLVLRAIELVRILREEGYRVIEVYPRATEKVLGLKMEKGVNEHEYDSLLCALTAKSFLEGNYEDLKGIVIPL